MTFWFPTAALIEQSWTPGAKVSRINLWVQRSLGSFVKLQVPLQPHSAASHPVTPSSSPGVGGVLSLVNVGSSGFTQSLVLTFQRTEPCANTPGPTRWLDEGGQDKDEGRRGGWGRTGKNSRVVVKITYITKKSSYPSSSSVCPAARWLQVLEIGEIFLRWSWHLPDTTKQEAFSCPLATSLSPPKTFKANIWGVTGLIRGALGMNGVKSPQNEKLFEAFTEPSGSCLSLVGRKVSLLHESLGYLWSRGKKKHGSLLTWQ